MDEHVQTTSVDDEPLCVCGYSKVGLPEIDHPCPECGSTKLAVYQSSYSYYGWNVALLGVGISLVHTLFVIVLLGMMLRLDLPDILDRGPWLYICIPLGGLSLLYTVISEVKREPKRKSVRNIRMALLSGLGYPILWFMVMLYVYQF